MKNNKLFFLFVVILAVVAGMIIKEKVGKIDKMSDCLSRRGTWNFMEGKCGK